VVKKGLAPFHSISCASIENGFPTVKVLIFEGWIFILSIMPRVSGTCWKCGTAWAGDSQPGRAEVCPKCGFDFRSCKNCTHHDSRYHNECRIPDTEVVREREKSNFCEDFQLASRKTAQTEQNPLDEARNRLNKLFGGG
jgi:hypothetical protein